MKCKTQTESYLRSVALPAATKSYTPIAHGDIIDETRQALQTAGFTVVSELYKAEQNGEIAAGFMQISTNDLDEDMAMTFNWTNSYNKMLKFSCGIGGLIYDNNVPFVCREAEATWARKHTGTAKQESTNVINQMITHAVHHFAKIVKMKDRFKQIQIDREEYSKLMGLLFFDKSYLGIEQSTQIRNEYNKPSYEYSCKGTLWEVYKMIMFGVREQSPKTWYKQQIELNTFISLRYYHGVPNQSKTELPNVNDHADLTSLNSNENEERKIDVPELVDVAFEDDGRPVPVYDDGAGNVDYPEIDADAEMQNLKTEQVIEERAKEDVVMTDEEDEIATKEAEEFENMKTAEVEFPPQADVDEEEDDTPVYDEDQIAERIKEDEAAVAEVCDYPPVTDEEAAELIEGQEAVDKIHAEELADAETCESVVIPAKEITEEQIEVLELENGVQDVEATPVEVEPEESIVPKVEVPEEAKEILTTVYEDATVTEVSEIDGATVIDLDSDEFFILED